MLPQQQQQQSVSSLPSDQITSAAVAAAVDAGEGGGAAAAAGFGVVMAPAAPCVEGLTGALPLDAIPALRLNKMSKHQSFMLQAIKHQVRCFTVFMDSF